MQYQIWGIEPTDEDKIVLMSFPHDNFRDANQALEWCKSTIRTLQGVGDRSLEVRIKDESWT